MSQHTNTSQQSCTDLSRKSLAVCIKTMSERNARLAAELGAANDNLIKAFGSYMSSTSLSLTPQNAKREVISVDRPIPTQEAFTYESRADIKTLYRIRIKHLTKPWMQPSL
eukprot:gnl/Chilomastix_caulleri/2981.p1 GENE.gnl/Chilomastix_caulleri/2981~~gnl/Chilomastix_caulleri/2981.p1  ORF type:complete len:111 (+),score=8.81 gnl/Chilomastix_caulleri/2981:129-461(+)